MHPRLLQENIVERVLYDRQGRLARVAFRVYESEGRLKAQVLHVEYIEEKLQPSPALALEGEVAESGAAPESASVAQPIVSPFVDSSFIYTIGSKPRAPAHR